MTERYTSFDRYHRQMLLPGFGEAAQARLARAHVLVVGCGALGSSAVDGLARAGVGTLSIVDRDLVELTNLQRQTLYDEADVEAATPKAVAAKAAIARVNRAVTVHAHVDDYNARNAEHYARGVDLIIDGLDNFETRYLINDLAVKHRVPWIYGGAVGTTGISLAVLPRAAAGTVGAAATRRAAPSRAPGPLGLDWPADDATPCLRCVFPEAPPPGASPTCDTAGVLGSVAVTVAAHQATQAIKLLTGNASALDRSLLSIDAWTNEIRRFDISGSLAEECPCCGRRRFDWLEGTAASTTTSLCGRDAIQITPAAAPAQGSAGLDLGAAAARLAAHGRFTHNAFLLRGNLDRERGEGGRAIELTLFTNGRAIIKGTTEPEIARSIYAKYVGS